MDDLKLYKHNEEAYEKAVNLLDSIGKACIIHPTGTGKSFIAMKLCLSYPEKQFCWLSPSKYIFSTQIDNLEGQGIEAPGNINYVTYQSLHRMEEFEIETLAPDYIILDEFHRCGAEMWGFGVNRLLKKYPKAKVLGLSATSIRYLDNQRDMAKELFSNAVASEMTLGKAIVLGILKEPRYILSAYVKGKELSDYEERIGDMPRSSLYRLAQKKFIRIKERLLEMNLSNIILENLPEKKGKYIVFCSCVEQLESISTQFRAWFQGENEATVYKVYHRYSSSNREYLEFLEDETERLKFLFSIDMLNEGVHVPGISGVILFRPTTSPIIYKQQIGRAMTVGEQEEPVIFDIVTNLSNLCSIGAVRNEMEEAIEQLKAEGREDEIKVPEIHVVHTDMELERMVMELEDMLSASWAFMYERASAYYEEHGTLKMSSHYLTEDGLHLGTWVYTQKTVLRNPDKYGPMDPERYEKLKKLGIDDVLDPIIEVRSYDWDIFYQAAKRYKEAYGTINVPKGTVTEDGIPLGQWIVNLRSCWRRKGPTLTEARIKALDELGIQWDTDKYVMERDMLEAEKYFERNRNLKVPQSYVTPSGVRLGNFIHRVRKRVLNGNPMKGLTPEIIHRLDKMGMQWEISPNRIQRVYSWDYSYGKAKEHFLEYGTLSDVTSHYEMDDGFKLGQWLWEQKRKALHGLDPEHRLLLERLGVDFEKYGKEYQWEQMYRRAERYYREYGNLNPPATYKIDIPHNLHHWVKVQRECYNGTDRFHRSLTQEQISRLERIGMVWEWDRSQWNSRGKDKTERKQRYKKVQEEPGLPAEGQKGGDVSTSSGASVHESMFKE